jgi:hypothetical protein
MGEQNNGGQESGQGASAGSTSVSILDVPENGAAGGQPAGGTADAGSEGAAGAGQSGAGDFEFDKRLYTDDGRFNKDGAKEYIGGLLGEIDTHKKRADDMRRKLSGNKAPEKPEEYFTGWTPADEKYKQVFAADYSGKDTVAGLTKRFAEAYHKAGLNKEQAADVSNSVLETLAETGVIDVRTPEEKSKAMNEWIAGQRKQLGGNADEIIRGSKQFVENAPAFDDKTKKQLLQYMEYFGAPFIQVVHSLKSAYGASAGRDIPANPQSLGAIPSDAELLDEYNKKDTSDLRRKEILRIRREAGRKGRLTDVLRE